MPKPAELGRTPLRGACAALIAALLCWTPLGAQDFERPLVPGGLLRLELVPAYESWSQRFGDSGSEPLGADLIDPAGVSLFPGVADLESTLRQWIQDPAFSATLGSTRAVISASRVRIDLGLSWGALDWLTLGFRMPVVKNRTEVEFSLRAQDGIANLGLNPAISRAPEVLAFTDELRLRVDAATSRAGELCGAAPGSPECQTATGVAAAGQELLTGFLSAYSASPFFPLAGSAPGEILQARTLAFNEQLALLEIPGLLRQPAFATAPLSASELETLLSDGAVGINTVPLGNRVGVWEPGDAELHVALRLLEGARQNVASGERSLQYQAGAGFLVRLGTGKEDDPDVFFDLPAGDGQTDLEGFFFSDVRTPRFGVRGQVRYGVQLSRTLLRRVGPAELVLIPALNRTLVEWTPGSYLELEVAPRFRLADELALTLSYRHFNKGEDTFARASAAPQPEDRSPLPSPPLYSDVSLLSQGTGQRSHELGGGLALSTLPAWQAGEASVPLDARLDVLWAVAGSGRTTPKGVRAELGLRLYLRLWGGGDG